jgi:hypothetical protein
MNIIKKIFRKLSNYSREEFSRNINFVLINLDPEKYFTEGFIPKEMFSAVKYLKRNVKYVVDDIDLSELEQKMLYACCDTIYHGILTLRKHQKVESLNKSLYANKAKLGQEYNPLDPIDSSHIDLAVSVLEPLSEMKKFPKVIIDKI